MVVSQNRGPQYRPQNTLILIIGTIILIIGTPKKGTPNFGKPPFQVSSPTDLTYFDVPDYESLGWRMGLGFTV